MADRNLHDCCTRNQERVRLDMERIRSRPEPPNHPTIEQQAEWLGMDVPTLQAMRDKLDGIGEEILSLGDDIRKDMREQVHGKPSWLRRAWNWIKEWNHEHS